MIVAPSELKTKRLGGLPAPRLWVRLSELSEHLVLLLPRARGVRKGETGGFKRLEELEFFFSEKIKQRNNLKASGGFSHRKELISLWAENRKCVTKTAELY